MRFTNDDQLNAYDRFRHKLKGLTPAFLTSTAQLLLAPADLAVLIGRAMWSEQVPAEIKAKLVFAGLYTGAGIDLIPELFLGPVVCLLAGR